MIRHFVIASVFALGGAALINEAVFANGTSNVPFGGSVVATCSFNGAPGAGTLGNPLPTTLSSKLADGGTSGSAVVKCTGATGSLKITGVTATSTLQPSSGATYTATAVGGAVNAAYATGTSSVGVPVLSGLDIPLVVDMAVIDSSPLAAGNYTFTVDLMVTP